MPGFNGPSQDRTTCCGIMSKQRSFLNLRAGRTADVPSVDEVAIDGYRIEALLGVGPLTAVYRATLESHQQAVAVKVLLPHLAASEVFVQRFLQAANGARMVTHDRVLPCYDVGQTNGWVYLAGELIEGATLAAIAASGELEQSRAVYLAWQVAMGLEAIHAAGLVHGNLRPTNVLVDDEDGVRLADLGLPVLADGDPSSALASPMALHMPPEAISREGIPDQSGDIYALGVLLLGSVLGGTPWSGLSKQRLAELHATGTPVLGEAPARMDADLRAVLARATARRPEERYRHAFQLREDLERLQYGFAPIHARTVESVVGSGGRDSGSRSGKVSPAPQPELAPRRRRPLLTAAVVAVACVVLILIGLALFGSAQTPVAAPLQPDLRPQLVAAAPKPIAAEPVTPKPDWAASAGLDAHGHWCDLAMNGRTQRFRLIKAGSFWMGSSADEPGRAADEERHLVTLSRDYWLGDSEVTQDFLAAVGCESASYFPGKDHPVESISWNGVQDVLARLGSRCGAPIRLPSEAEWEYACRAGGSAITMPTSDSAWTAVAAAGSTIPVRTLKPNAWGLYDMQGNVAEWVEDTYGRYGREPTTDPIATGGVHRVIRGGAWNLDPSESRAAARGKALAITTFSNLGFRLAVSATGFR
jgi:hypothetical protein